MSAARELRAGPSGEVVGPWEKVGSGERGLRRAEQLGTPLSTSIFLCLPLGMEPHPSPAHPRPGLAHHHTGFPRLLGP